MGGAEAGVVADSGRPQLVCLSVVGMRMERGSVNPASAINFFCLVI